MITIKELIVRSLGVFLALCLLLSVCACSTADRKQPLPPQTSGTSDDEFTSSVFQETTTDFSAEASTGATKDTITETKPTPPPAATKPDTTTSDFPKLPEVIVTEADVATFSGVTYYKADYIVPYIAYKRLYPTLSTEDVITRVNIGLHTPFYSNVKTITNPDNMLVLCNKYNTLGADYVPADLVTINEKYAASGQRMRKEAAEAFVNLSKAATKAGYTIIAASTYRSYTYQNTLYNRYVSQKGQAQADLSSARAGTSEHQTGLAVDVATGGTIEELANFNQFGKTPAYQWAKDNIHNYGFIIRYPEGKTHITGYKPEPWHFRYVGIETAKAVYESGLTYDEYYVRYIAK